MKMDQEAEKRTEEHTRKWLEQEEEHEAREEEHEQPTISCF